MDRFVFTGKIVRVKENELEVKTYESGWMSYKLNFMVISGENRHYLSVSAGKWDDKMVGKSNVIYTYSKSTNGAAGESLKIDWNDRFNKDIIDNVAHYRKSIIDLSNGSPQDDINYKQYISTYDFITELFSMFENGDFENSVVEVSGNIEHSYSVNKDRYYTNCVPNKIKLVASDAAQRCEGSVVVYYCKEASGGVAFDTSSVADNKTATLNGYTKYYDSSAKKNGYAPISITIPVDSEQKLKACNLLFGSTTDSQVRRVGLKINMINGSQKVEVSEATLTDEQKQFIEAGLTTLEEIQAEANTSAYGERIVANVMCGIMNGYSRGSAIEEAMTSIELVTPPIPENYEVKTSNIETAMVSDDALDDMMDIFN